MNGELTREQAIEIARGCAFVKHDAHGYLPETADSARAWMPHEWVIDAIRMASRPTPAPGALPELPEALAHANKAQLIGVEFADSSILGRAVLMSRSRTNKRTEPLYTAEQMHAYARAYAEQCRAGVVVTDAMVERAVRAAEDWDAEGHITHGGMRAALHSALADDEGVRK